MTTIQQNTKTKKGIAGALAALIAVLGIIAGGRLEGKHAKENTKTTIEIESTTNENITAANYQALATELYNRLNDSEKKQVTIAQIVDALMFYNEKAKTDNDKKTMSDYYNSMASKQKEEVITQAKVTDVLFASGKIYPDDIIITYSNNLKIISDDVRNIFKNQKDDKACKTACEKYYGDYKKLTFTNNKECAILERINAVVITIAAKHINKEELSELNRVQVCDNRPTDERKDANDAKKYAGGSSSTTRVVDAGGKHVSTQKVVTGDKKSTTDSTSKVSGKNKTHTEVVSEGGKEITEYYETEVVSVKNNEIKTGTMKTSDGTNYGIYFDADSAYYAKVLKR